MAAWPFFSEVNSWAQGGTVAGFDLCKDCGTPMAAGICPRCQESDSSRLIHRDILLLVSIAVLGVVVFFFTRAMAAREREMDYRVAASWYQTGEQFLKAGQVKSAIDSFRRATSNDYENRQYHLALAEALAEAGHNEEARYALLRLREAAPENSEINLQLGRLEAKRGDMAESVRYYHNALYGLWTGSHVDQEQRNVRVELIHLLLDHQQRTQALSEILILESEIPEEPAAQKELAELFLASSDASHALKYFVRAAHLAKHDPDALAGAGEASFQMGDYPQADRYLEAAVAIRDEEPTRSRLSLTKMILANDPLASGLTREERNRRLKVGFERALLTLESCIGQQPKSGDKKEADLETLHAEALTARQKLQPQNLKRDPELLVYGVEMIDKIEETAKLSCGEPQGLDEALMLIGRRYRGAHQ